MTSKVPETAELESIFSENSLLNEPNDVRPPLLTRSLRLIKLPPILMIEMSLGILYCFSMLQEKPE